MQKVSFSVDTADSNVLQTQRLQVIGEKLRAPTLCIRFLWGDVCYAPCGYVGQGDDRETGAAEKPQNQ